MAEEKYVEYKGGSLRRGRSPLMWFLDTLLALLTLALVVAMPMIYLVPYVGPARMWLFPVAALAAPALYVLTAVLACYWILRWRLGRAGLLLLLLAVGLFKVPLFWRPQFGRVYGTEKYGRSTVKVLSYNVRYFYDTEGGSCAGRVAELIDSLEPDIVCLQEFNPRLAGLSERFGQLEKKYHAARFGLGADAEPSQAILSRHRILRSGVLLSPESSVWADVQVGDDTLRVFNNHLRTTSIKAADNDYITGHGFIGDTARETKLRSMAGRLRRNSILRAEQVDSIAGAMDGMARERRLVCGDFNDTPMSYVYRKMARGLDDAFAQCGEGYSYTYRGFFDMLRIDYVLTAPDLEVLSYEELRTGCSDHYPLFVRLKVKAMKN
ncbi:MAG: endonuclease/exonuclease/phosphatase family protein [Alistipes sp.]|nr:endonuclease/exonuclease/phosphatase family protein [Alistipes sp.]